MYIDVQVADIRRNLKRSTDPMYDFIPSGGQHDSLSFFSARPSYQFHAARHCVIIRGLLVFIYKQLRMYIQSIFYCYNTIKCDYCVCVLVYTDTLLYRKTGNQKGNEILGCQEWWIVESELNAPSFTIFFFTQFIIFRLFILNLLLVLILSLFLSYHLFFK